MKISEGLMHLQENSVGVSAQVQGPQEEWECQTGSWWEDRREKHGGEALGWEDMWGVRETL